MPVVGFVLIFIVGHHSARVCIGPGMLDCNVVEHADIRANLGIFGVSIKARGGFTS